MQYKHKLIQLYTVFHCQTDKLAGGLRGTEMTWNHRECRSCELWHKAMLPMDHFSGLDFFTGTTY